MWTYWVFADPQHLSPVVLSFIWVLLLEEGSKVISLEIWQLLKCPPATHKCRTTLCLGCWWCDGATDSSISSSATSFSAVIWFKALISKNTDADDSEPHQLASHIHNFWSAVLQHLLLRSPSPHAVWKMRLKYKTYSGSRKNTDPAFVMATSGLIKARKNLRCAPSRDSAGSRLQ